MKKFERAAVLLFAAAAVVCIVITAMMTKPASMRDGVWSGSAAGFKGDIQVSITVQDGKITSAKVTDIQDSDFAVTAAHEIAALAEQTGKVSGLDTISGATFTSKGTIVALRAAADAASGKKRPSAVKPTDTSCDIVIIGAGGAGMSAAVEARSHGASVIVLEKMGITGGNTSYATGGLNASETNIQKKLGISDSNEQYFKDTMEGGKNLNDPQLVRTMVENSAKTVDWLLGLGADLTDVGKMAGSTNQRTHRPVGGAAVGGHLVSVLDKAARDAGADIRLENRAVSIINDNGKAAGVRVSTKAGDYTISAKAVIIAAGGFGANPDIIVAYKPDLAGFGTTNHAGATGDALEMVKPFDAALVDMEQIQTHPTVVPVKNLMITEAVRGNGAIMVNREGLRFGSEMATRDVMSEAILRQTGKTAYLVFDQSVRESLKAIESYAEQGLLTEGATLAELAEKLHIPAAAFEKTVQTYNGYVAAGNDAEFGRKGSEMPRDLIKAPYYAVEVGPAVHHTMGGLKITEKAEVVSNSDSIVPALYAAGEVVGGVHGANRLGGNAVADIIVFGKIAGEQACAYIGK
ncbi:MAG: flavocytochrome c [Bacteroides sp.]|nr:flavocytochrome c [Prevotella sp.]MCM1407585.1 flavocytochrome c [Treponema brennaborense]MCM1469265.1 flavocytochrome c [Bacteroides sp.]